MGGLAIAIRTLSILPLPGKDASQLSKALGWFPLVGGLLGGLLYGAALLLEMGLPQWPALLALLLIVLQTVLTGGIHLDGVADGADALFSMTDREKKLAIMKDSRLGTFGVLALICVLALKWVLLTRLLELDAMYAMVLAMVVSRASQVEVAVTMPYARETNGTARGFVESAGLRHRVVSWGVTAAVMVGFGPFALACVPLAVASCALLRKYFMKKIGGVTGDLLGASSEIVELIVLLLCGAIHNANLWNIITWNDLGRLF